MIVEVEVPVTWEKYAREAPFFKVRDKAHKEMDRLLSAGKLLSSVTYTDLDGCVWIIHTFHVKETRE